MSAWHAIFTVPLRAAHIGASAIVMSHVPLFPCFRVSLFRLHEAEMTIYHEELLGAAELAGQAIKKKKKKK